MNAEHFNLATFLEYYKKVRQRTLRVVKLIPPDKLEWTYKEGKFTLGDLVRHIAAIERYMYAENAQFKPSRYPGCGAELANGYQNVLDFFNQTHAESMQIFNKLTDETVQRKCITPGGTEITLWKWLRLMAEHEIHHRGQIYLYLAMLDVPLPQLYGLTSEEVKLRSE